MRTYDASAAGANDLDSKRSSATIELIKYLVVGGLNAVFTFVLFVTSVYVLKFHYLLALSIAWGLGFVLTYVLNFVWVFKPERQLRFQWRFAKYVFTNILTFGLNLVLLYGMIEWGGFDPFSGQVVAMIFIVALNFFAAKFWSLQRKS